MIDNVKREVSKAFLNCFYAMVEDVRPGYIQQVRRKVLAGTKYENDIDSFFSPILHFFVKEMTEDKQFSKEAIETFICGINEDYTFSFEKTIYGEPYFAQSDIWTVNIYLPQSRRMFTEVHVEPRRLNEYYNDVYSLVLGGGYGKFEGLKDFIENESNYHLQY